MRNLERVFWGVFWIACAVLLLCSKMGYFTEIGITSLVLTSIFAAWAIKSLIRFDIAGMIFPLAFIGIIYADKLGIEEITPWPLLLAALLATIGISMIYRPKHHARHNGYKHCQWNDENTQISSEEGNEIRVDAHFGSTIKYIKSDDFRKMYIDNQFGGLKIYFDDAMIQNGEAEINIDAAFSGTELYIPKSWNVIHQVHVSFGGVDEKNHSETTGAPKVYLTGNMSFGGITIIYI